LHSTLLFGKLVSLVTICIGVSIGLYGDLNFQELLNIGFASLWVLVPIWMSLFVDWIHGLPCTCGVIGGMIGGIALEMWHQEAPDFATGNDLVIGSGIWAGIIAVLVTGMVTVILMVVYPAALDDDNKVIKMDQIPEEVLSLFGPKRLTLTEINQFMEPCTEIWDTWLGKILWTFSVFSVLIALPWYNPIDDAYYSFGPLQEEIGGWPTWARNLVICQSASTIVLVFITFLWNGPGEESKDASGFERAMLDMLPRKPRMQQKEAPAIVSIDPKSKSNQVLPMGKADITITEYNYDEDEMLD